MSTLTRPFIAFILFFFATATFIPSPTEAKNPVQKPEAPATAVEAPKPVEAEEKKSSERANIERTIMVTVQAKRFTLVYPYPFTEKISVNKVVQNVLDAFERIEKTMGNFEKKITIFVPEAIVPDANSFPSRLTIAGVTYEHRGDISVAVAIWASKNEEVFAHELFHARLRDIGVRPPRWLEEGMAHSIETEDLFSDELYEALKKDGAMTLENAKLYSERGVTSKEVQLRASGWAVAYYLVKIKGKTLEDVVKMKEEDLPEPKVAFEAIKRLREPQAPAPEPEAQGGQE